MSSGLPGDQAEVVLGSGEAMFCDHANECPNVCPCVDNCYCKGRTCPSVVPRKKAAVAPPPPPPAENSWDHLFDD